MDLFTLLNIIGQLVDYATPVVAALAVLYFFWGLAQFILVSEADKRKEGRTRMVWGIIALFVMLSIWGIIGLLQNTFLRGTQGNFIPLYNNGGNQLPPGYGGY